MRTHLARTGFIRGSDPTPLCQLDFLEGIMALRGSGPIPDVDNREFVTFLQSMMKLDPEERPSAMEILNHPWLDDFSEVQVIKNMGAETDFEESED